MFNKKIILIAVSVLCVFSMCMKKNTVKTDSTAAVELNAVDSLKAEKILSLVRNINDNSPETFSISYNVLGKSGSKKYKVTGSSQFDRNRSALYAVFKDYIFKTTIASVFQDGSNLAFYYPPQKRLVYDSSKNINIKNYINFEIDYSLLYNLISGRLPVIENSRVVRVFESTGGRQRGVILKNSEYYESIFFKDKLPEKIKLINIKTKDEAEIYLGKHIKRGGSSYFSRVRIVVPENDLDVEITFYNIRLNKQVRVKKIMAQKIKPGVKVIRMN